MNKVFITISVLALFFASQVFAASSHDAHTSKKAAHAMDNAAKSHTGHEDHVSGMKIHESHQDGYVFEYRLIDMKEKMKR
jgi:hypothetical protein